MDLEREPEEVPIAMKCVDMVACFLFDGFLRLVLPWIVRDAQFKLGGVTSNQSREKYKNAAEPQKSIGTANPKITVFANPFARC